jgi:outer membrane protein
MSCAVPQTRPHRARIGLRRCALALLLALAALMAADLPAQAVRIGYVDTQRLLDNAPQVLDARARLAREFAARDLRLQGDEQRLADLEARQRATSDPAGSEAALRLAAEVTALRRSVERTRQRLRSELSARTEEEIDRAFPRINEAVAEFAREQGLDLVLSSPVIYASGRLDITDAVLDRMRRDFRPEP